MPKGYWIAHIQVEDAESYPQYVPLSTAAIAAHGGRFLVRGGVGEVAEGEALPRHIVVEFPSLGDAQACYHSAQYEAAKSLRQAYAQTDLIIVEGA